MGERVPDELLHAISPVGDPKQVAAELNARWGDVAERITLYFNYHVDAELQLELVDNIRR